MSKRIIRIVLILVVIGVVALLAYNKVNKDDQQSAQRASLVEGSGQIMADAFVVHPASLKNDINATGTLLSNEAVQLMPQTSGRITGLLFKEGAYVHKGDLLVTLYDGDLQAQLKKAVIQQTLADTTLARQKQLLAINGISRQAVDNTHNQVASYQADIAYYKAQISKMNILAPFSGRLGLRQVSEGAIVTPTTVITTLYQNDPLKLEFSIPEKYRNQIKVGNEVSFSVSESPDQSFPGKIYAINPGIDPQTRTVTLRAWVANREGLLSPGSFADVHIELHEIPKALMIPTQALIPTTQDAQVILYREGKARFVTVQTGIRTADKIQVTQGLQSGDTVLTTGIMQATAGSSVRLLSVVNEP